MLPFNEFGQPSRLQRLQGKVWQQHGLQVFMKREDERDVLVGGNKWCKLLGHLQQARADGVKHLVSVGGLWSNHLHALAFAAKQHGFSVTGIVRGEAQHMTPTLREAEAAGMQLKFVSREEYRQRHDALWQAAACADFEAARFIPEGGAGAASLAGLTLLAHEIAAQVDGEAILALAVGSGTTLAGLRHALPERIRVCGFQAFVDPSLSQRISTITGSEAGWSLLATDGMRHHASLPAHLQHFLHDFEQEEGIALDTVYTVRMMHKLAAMVTAGLLPAGGHVIALHSGGLQGRRGHVPALAA